MPAKRRKPKTSRPAQLELKDTLPLSPVIYSNTHVQIELLKKYKLHPIPDTKIFVEVFNNINARQKRLEVESPAPLLRTDGNDLAKEQKTMVTELTEVKQEREVLLSIAHRAVLHIKKSGGRPEELREIIEFAHIQDQEFIKFLFTCLLEQQFFTNPSFLQTLKLVILCLDKTFYEK